MTTPIKLCCLLLLLLLSGSAALAQHKGSDKTPTVETAPAATNSPTEPATTNSPVPPPPTSQVDEPLPFMTQSENNVHAEAPSTGGLMLRTVGALLLIVGLIVAVSWGIKRFGGARFGTPSDTAPALAVLNSLSLGERRSLAIVQFGERMLLLGSTPQSVTVLAETKNEVFVPQGRSVAEILSSEDSADFAEELLNAADELKTGSPRGSYGTA
jgi:flagellar biosynthetic protein FliO